MLAAADAAEIQKRTKYRHVLQRGNIAPDKFIPIAIEATGRFGKETVKFFNLVSRQSPRPDDIKRRYLFFCKKRIRAAILRGNADCKSSFIRNVNEVRHIVPITVFEETKNGID